jgi:hypothetical protein
MVAAPVVLFTVKSASGICMPQSWISVPLRCGVSMSTSMIVDPPGEEPPISDTFRLQVCPPEVIGTVPAVRK